MPTTSVNTRQDSVTIPLNSSNNNNPNNGGASFLLEQNGGIRGIRLWGNRAKEALAELQRQDPRYHTIEQKTITSINSSTKSHEDADKAIKDPLQREIYGATNLAVLKKLFNLNGSSEKTSLVQSLGLNTRKGQLKLIAALALAGVGAYFLMNNSGANIATVADSTQQLNTANDQISALQNDLKNAQEIAEKAKKYTRARDALLKATCKYGEPKTSPASLAAKAIKFFEGCKESPEFQGATQAIVNAPKK